MVDKNKKGLSYINNQLYQRITWFTSTRTMLMLTIVIVFIASLGVGFLVRNYVGKVNREFNDMYYDSANLYVTTVKDKIISYTTAMGVVSMSNELRDNIFTTDISRLDMVDLSKKLGQNISETTFFLYQAEEIISHRVYTYLPGDGYYFWNINEVQDKEWFSDLKSSSPQWWYNYSNVTNSNQLTLAGIIYNYNTEVGTWGKGYCCQTITVDTATLFKPYAAMSDHLAFVIDNKTGSLVYDYLSDSKNNGKHTIPVQISNIYKNAENKNFSGKVSLVDDNGKATTYTAISRQIDIIDATALLLFNTKQMKEKEGIGAIYGTVILLFCMMLLLILSNWLYNKRLNKIIIKMDRFDEKDVHLPEPIRGMDELSRIDRHLVRMQRRILTLIQEEYTAKMQVMTAHQEALMACINPHFLYNTLNTISAMACVEGADSTTEMIASLSDMFRYSSDVSKRHVCLKDELNNITDYLYIQSIRYQNAFTYHVDIDESLYEYQVPKLILQPLIENAFKHGFKNRVTEREGDRQLYLSAKKKGEDIIITVQDNGKGIDKQKLNEINAKLTESESKMNAMDYGNGSIGLLNVHQRIRLGYGSGYGLQIQSEGEGLGVIITLKIPCRK